MACSAAKMAHLPLSHYTVEQLHERGRELREMATTARIDADIQALQVLAGRFDALVERRRMETNQARPAMGRIGELMVPETANGAAGRTGRRTNDQAATYPPCPEFPTGTDFADAWRIACRHVSERFVFPETLHHPAVVRECYELACMIMAYGLVPKRSASSNLAAARTPAANSTATGHRVIVVDDVADVLVSVGAFLVNAGFGVRKASDGDEALKLIASDPCIDVLVTDFAMPGLNGAELIAQATQIRPCLKAVVITGYPNADGLGALPAGTTVLTKPFRRDALVTAVRSLFQKVAASREDAAQLAETAPHYAKAP
jgi:CheY-like chemotaxis protein